MSGQRPWIKFGAASVAVLGILVTAYYYGLGRWWGKASAIEIRTAILSSLDSQLPYRNFAAALTHHDAHSVTVEFWLPKARLEAGRAKPDIGEPDNIDLSNTELRRAAGRITYGRGTVADGRYRFTIIVRRRYDVGAFQESVMLADCIGELTLTLYNGRIRRCSLALRDLSELAQFEQRFAGVLLAVRDPIQPTKYGRWALQLIDGRACDFTTAEHIERLYASPFQWPNIVTERLVHLGFIGSLREPPIDYRPDHFALASADLLGIPQAATFGSALCRVCVLATLTNTFGESVNGEQSILALDQSDGKTLSTREIRRVVAVGFNAPLINGLVTGRLSSPLFSYVLTIAFVIALAIVVKYVLSVLVQIKTLLSKQRS